MAADVAAPLSLIAETTVHNSQSATVGYAYDALGNRIQTVLPDSRSINYLYYGSGHLHQINLDGKTPTDIARDQLHQEISRSQGALTSLFDYDPMGRLNNQRTVYGDNRKQSALISGAVNRRYSYDKAGNLIQTADQRSGVLDYVYDKIGRIESATNYQHRQPPARIQRYRIHLRRPRKLNLPPTAQR